MVVSITCLDSQYNILEADYLENEEKGDHLIIGTIYVVHGFIYG
jgi:hypothetical protein